MAKTIDYKKAYIKNRREIVQNLENGDAVADELFSLKTFTDEMKENVHQEKEKEKKNRKILETLNYRGKNGVKQFHRALLKTSNEDLAKCIAPYVLELEGEEFLYMPSAWPPSKEEQKKMETHSVIKIEDLKHPKFVHDYSANDVYKMQNLTRGMVYIINNETFSSLKSRPGSGLDAKNLQSLFEDLQFKVETRHNLTVEGMKDFLASERDKVQWEEMECVILVIASHGADMGVYGTNGNIVPLKDLTEIFTSKSCPGLNGKPRLIFAQACRIYSKAKNVTNEGQDQNSDVASRKDTNQFHQKELQNPDLHASDSEPASLNLTPSFLQTFHPDTDFFIAFATTEGFAAYRHKDIGSWFLNAVMWTFKYHAHHEEIQHLMLKVNSIVAIARKGDNIPGVQVSECRHSLRKKFFFFPGVYDQPPQKCEQMNDKNIG